jgi:hypothetical protein
MEKIVRFSFEKIPSMPCNLCSHWRDAKRTGFLEDDENEEQEKQTRRKTAGTRNCNVSKKEVGPVDEACENFLMHHDFWCRKNCQWYDVVVCIARQHRNQEGCGKCSQGGLIWKYIRATKLERSLG